MNTAVAEREIYIDEKEIDMTDIYEKLRLGQDEIDRGETVDGNEVFAALREKYGY